MTVKKKAASRTASLTTMETPKDLKRYLQEFDDNLPDDEDALWNGAIYFMNAEILNLIHAGQCFIKLKAKSGHGNFIKALNERGLSRFYASDRIRIAERFTQIEIPNVDACQHLGISKIRKIISWDDLQIIDFLQGKEVFGLTLDDAKNMNTKSFEATIKENRDDTAKKLSQENKRLQTDLDDAKDNIEDLKNRLEHQNLLGPWPELVNIVRTESAALSEQATISLDDLSRVLDKLIDEGDELDESDRNAATVALIHSLRAIQAKSQILLSTLVNKYGAEDDLASQHNIVQLTKTELELIFARRQLFMNDRENARINRAKEREAKLKKGKGRPREHFEEI